MFRFWLFVKGLLNNMKLSEKEKRVILESRKKEADKLPKMIGYTKEDLYQVNDYKREYWFVSASERKEIIDDFVNNYIELSVSAGTQFDCFIEDGKEAWYDTESGLFSNMSAEWAKKYLCNINLCKKKKVQ